MRAPAPAWRPLPHTGFAHGYSGVKAVRVGSRVVVMADASTRGTRVRGLVYDLRAGRWARVARSPLRWRGGSTLVGTRRGAIVWGGLSGIEPVVEGARYNPATEKWKRLAPAPLRPRGSHTAIWTGRRMLVWGGTTGRKPLADGAAYDPRRDRWKKLAPAPIGGRQLHTAVWTGRKMLIWGGDLSGRSMGEGGRFGFGGASYDPAADRWAPISPSPVRATPTARAVWTGKKMIVWTGAKGAEYDPAADRWRRIPPAPLALRVEHTAVFGGGEMLVWGGNTCGTCFRADGAAYDPVRRRWRKMAPGPLTGRDRHAAVAIPGGMFVWGGCCNRVGPTYPADGALYARGRPPRPRDPVRRGGPATFRPLPAGWRSFDDGGLSRGRGGSTSEAFATSWAFDDSSPYGWAGELPPGGIVVSVLLLPRAEKGKTIRTLCRGVVPQPGYPPIRRLPLQVPDTPEGILEGSSEVAEYRIRGTVRKDYQLELRVAINQPLPHTEPLRRAQRVVDGLRLPDWPTRC